MGRRNISDMVVFINDNDDRVVYMPREAAEGVLSFRLDDGKVITFRRATLLERAMLAADEVNDAG